MIARGDMSRFERHRVPRGGFTDWFRVVFLELRNND
jgi:hypothetical protein